MHPSPRRLELSLTAVGIYLYCDEYNMTHILGQRLWPACKIILTCANRKKAENHKKKDESDTF